MATGPFHEDAQRRKAIFVLDRPEIDLCEYKEGGPDLLLNEEIHILEYPLQDASRIVQDIVDRGLVRPGAVLVQSPFDGDRYESAMEARKLFALGKESSFFYILHAPWVLGGWLERRFGCARVRRRRRGRRKYAAGSVNSLRLLARRQTKMNGDIEELRLSLVDTFEGAQGSLKDAEKLLRQNKSVR